MPCTHCHIDPCHSDSYSVALNEWAFTLRTQNNPSAVRRELYKRYVHAVHGHLGYRNRVVIPECVLSHIRKMFPDPESEYMGHMDE